jgi:hypothetical protein
MDKQTLNPWGNPESHYMTMQKKWRDAESRAAMYRQLYELQCQETAALKAKLEQLTQKV